MKVPFKLTAAVPVPERNQQTLHALALGYPRLDQRPIDEHASMSIACYGPSLRDTWQQLTRPILSMSGATKWLVERGIVPDFHCDMDPRANKVYDIDPGIEGVHYLMASICHPYVFEQLKGKPITLWHTYSGVDPQGEDTYGFINRVDPGALVVHGGSTIGLTALHLGGLMGYRHFEVHGMDGSFAGDARHAGIHLGNEQFAHFTWQVEGKEYRTSQIMANACAEAINTVKNYPLFCVFHGEGLTQALIREANFKNACTARETEKADLVRRARPTFLPIPPVEARSGAFSFWDALLLQPHAGQAVLDVAALAREAEQRRSKAMYNTGTVPEETAILLRLMAQWFKPKVVVEIGTFIGTSTMAMATAVDCTVHTCDRSNDCLPSSEKVRTHPGWSSTQLLQSLVDAQESVDLFFFDGRLVPEDLPLIERLSHPQTVFAFDDCNGNEKGVKNVSLVMPMTPQHVLAAPPKHLKDRTTLGVLLPLTQHTDVGVGHHGSPNGRSAPERSAVEDRHPAGSRVDGQPQSRQLHAV